MLDAAARGISANRRLAAGTESARELTDGQSAERGQLRQARRAGFAQALIDQLELPGGQAALRGAVGDFEAVAKQFERQQIGGQLDQNFAREARMARFFRQADFNAANLAAAAPSLTGRLALPAGKFAFPTYTNATPSFIGYNNGGGEGTTSESFRHALMWDFFRPNGPVNLPLAQRWDNFTFPDSDMRKLLFSGFSGADWASSEIGKRIPFNLSDQTVGTAPPPSAAEVAASKRRRTRASTSDDGKSPRKASSNSSSLSMLMACSCSGYGAARARPRKPSERRAAANKRC